MKEQCEIAILDSLGRTEMADEFNYKSADIHKVEVEGKDSDLSGAVWGSIKSNLSKSSYSAESDSGNSAGVMLKNFDVDVYGKNSSSSKEPKISSYEARSGKKPEGKSIDAEPAEGLSGNQSGSPDDLEHKKKPEGKSIDAEPAEGLSGNQSGSPDDLEHKKKPEGKSIDAEPAEGLSGKQSGKLDKLETKSPADVKSVLSSILAATVAVPDRRDLSPVPEIKPIVPAPEISTNFSQVLDGLRANTLTSESLQKQVNAIAILDKDNGVDRLVGLINKNAALNGLDRFAYTKPNGLVVIRDGQSFLVANIPGRNPWLKQ